MKILQQWETKYGKKIYLGYKKDITIFLKTVNFDVLEASYQDIVRYLEVLRNSGASAYVLRNRLFAIKFYYKCLLDFGYIQAHPCESLILQDKVNSQVPTALLYNQKELEDFLQRKIGKVKPLQLRNKVIQQLLVYQALTVSEIVQLTVDNIDLENCKIHITKTDLNSRTLPLKAQQLLPLHQYVSTTRLLLLKQQKSEILLLSKTGNKIPSATLSASINKGFDQKFIPKRIRQSVIHNLLKKGNTLPQVQYFAGYKEIISVERYKHNDIDTLKQQILKYHPLRKQ